MLANFALEAIGTSVSCNKINTDGYDSSNLINSNFLHRKKGFLAEHFIKPPVDITFRLPCNVNLSCIILSPFVGRQQSSQLDIYIASRPMPKTKHGKRRAAEQRDSSSFLDEQEPMFYPVSKVNISNQTRICFYNRRLTDRYNQSKNLISTFEPSATVEMRHAKSELLIAATHVTVRISRVQNGSTPALSNVEIWGSVSSGVDDTLRKSIQNKYHAYCRPNPPISTDNMPSSSSGEKGKDSEGQTSSSINCEIPEEFIDPFTCEIMAIPMLLPSGKNIDKSSLDRYNDSEASHGRQPRDPFTGVEFNCDIKPIPNGPLKVRIDLFLSKNSEDPTVGLLSRTVKAGYQGKRNQKCSLHVSTIVKNKESASESFSYSYDCKDQCSVTNKRKINQLTHPFTATSSLVSDKSFSDGSYHPLSKKSCPPKDADQRPLPSVVCKPAVGKSSHESLLKDSLNDALVSLLKSAPIDEQSSSSEQAIPSCSKCDKQIKGEVVAYTTPCSHVLCRTCLLDYTSDKSIQCLTCGINFLKSNIVRIYTANS